MKEQLLLLIELQKHDAKIVQIKTEMADWPARLATMQGDVGKVEALLARERQELDETEKWRRDQEEDFRDQESQLIKAKQRSSLVKNTKEAMANERELQATRKAAQDREEEVAKLGVAVEDAKKKIEAHEGELQNLRNWVEKEEKAGAEAVAGLQEQLKMLEQEREVAAGRVKADVLKKYSSIRMRRGLALAAVVGGTCQGCHMNIPPQVFNQLQRGDTIEYCGNCNRIVYWDRILEPIDPSTGSAADKSATV